MAELIDFCAYREKQDARQSNQNATEIQADFSRFQEGLSRTTKIIMEIKRSLSDTNLAFLEHIQSCEILSKKNKEIQELIASNNLEEMEAYRNNLAEKIRLHQRGQ